MPAAAVIREVLVLFFMIGRKGYVDCSFCLKLKIRILSYTFLTILLEFLARDGGTFNSDLKCADSMEHEWRRRPSIKD